MAYPFDTDTTSYAYATGVFEHGFGQFNLYMRLANLARSYPLDAIDLTLRSQCSAGAEHKGPEPFYAVRLLASNSYDGIDVLNLPRLTKGIAKLERAVKRIDDVAGAPASLLEEQMMRYLRAAQIEHLYVKAFNGSGSIPDWHHVNPKADAERALSALRGLKHATLRAAGVAQ